MNIPVCYFCLKSGFLCQSCSDKLMKGEITQLDLEVIKSLLELEARFPQLRSCTFHRAIEVPELIFIFVDCRKKVPKSVWRKVSKSVSEEKKKTVRIVEKTSSLKAFLTQVLFPARIASINTIWLPDGSWESSVKVPATDFKKLPADPKVLETLIKDVISEKVTIVPTG
ncbi:MAG: hypothetical protein N3H31_02695 [Candidatus Nezhaarchaeota archaeon]|nr:hypothetical protein [Candidatus Nezhaarchaeota archaeon]